MALTEQEAADWKSGELATREAEEGGARLAEAADDHANGTDHDSGRSGGRLAEGIVLEDGLPRAYTKEFWEESAAPSASASMRCRPAGTVSDVHDAAS